MTLLKCGNCGEICRPWDLVDRPEYVDDSGIPAFYTPVCPYCGNDELEDYDEEEDEDEH